MRGQTWLIPKRRSTSSRVLAPLQTFAYEICMLVSSHLTRCSAGAAGADDFLVARGPAAFKKLVEKAIVLGQPAFKPWRTQGIRAETGAAGGGNKRNAPQFHGRIVSPTPPYPFTAPVMALTYCSTKKE
jgi:hypothetical protein